MIVSALGITLYNIWDSARAENVSFSALEILMPQIELKDVGMSEYGGRPVIVNESGETEYPDYILNPKMPMPLKTVDGNDYIGVISIPSINIELPIISEWSYPRLKAAPCRYCGTLYQRNLVICAHNYRRHFGHIKDLRIGDSVFFTDMDGFVFRYKVTEVLTLDPMAIEEMRTGDWDLTLFTCTLGGRTRVTVRCELAEDYGFKELS